MSDREQDPAPPPTGERRAAWTLLSNHGAVLLCLARQPDIRTREIAARTELSERAVWGILADLTEAGCITRIRHGRCNRYELHDEALRRSHGGAYHSVGQLLHGFAGPAGGPADAPEPPMDGPAPVTPGTHVSHVSHDGLMPLA